MNVDELLTRLSGVKKSGNGWTACCPVHDDRTPSLSIGIGDNGTILLTCHAGCGFDAICNALGLTPRELMGDRRNSASGRRSKRKIVGTYDYSDEHGAPLLRVVRTDPKGFYQQRPDGNGGWVNGTKGVRRVLYRLPQLLAADATAWHLVVEGEKDADNLRALGLVATTNPGGADKFGRIDSSPLHGRCVAILPDNDDAGRKHAQDVARRLQGKAAEVRVVELPELPEKGDVSDWLAAGGTAEQLLALVDATPSWTPVPDGADDAPSTEGNRDAKRTGPSTATVLVELAQLAELFHNANGDAFATIPRNGHRETWPIRSRGFKSWLLGLYYAKRRSAPGAQAVQDALATIEARAVNEGELHETYVRRAERDGIIHIDLADKEYRTVRVSADGWEVCADSPIKFIRRPGMLPLPVPERGGSIAQLRRFVNIPDDSDFVLAVAWLVGAARPCGPFPVLVVNGEQGGAKSTTCRALRRLVDPSNADLASGPRDERDLLIAAFNSAVIGFDNMSCVPVWLSDAMCRIATGGGIRTRSLYTDTDEVILNVQRPILINGIDELVSRSDLLDRAVRITLPMIDEVDYRSEADFWTEYEAARPAMFGALLDALSTALRNLDRVRLKTSTRMADFARFVAAAEPSLPWRPGTFIEAYTGNRRSAHELAIEASPVANVLRLWFEGIPSGEWVGSASELLTALEATLPTRDGRPIKPDGWPKRSNRLSGQLARLAPNLRAVGIHVIRDRDDSRARHRQLTIRKVRSAIVQDRPIVQEPVSGAPSGELFGRSPDDTPRVSDDQIALDRTVADDSDDPSPTSSGADRDGSGFADSFGGWADIDDNPNATAWADA